MTQFYCTYTHSGGSNEGTADLQYLLFSC